MSSRRPLFIALGLTGSMALTIAVAGGMLFWRGAVERTPAKPPPEVGPPPPVRHPPHNNNWSGFPVGSRAEYVKTKGGAKTASERWSLQLQGFCQEGYPVLQRFDRQGPDAGVVTRFMEMPLPEIRQQDARVGYTGKTVMKVSGRAIPCVERHYSCKDPWGRPWSAGTRTTSELRLPVRPFDSWFVDASLGSDTIFAWATVKGQTLASRLVAIDRPVEVGGRKVKCFEEQETLKAPGTKRTTTFWRSLEVPDCLVRSVSVSERQGRREQETTELVNFSHAK